MSKNRNTTSSIRKEKSTAIDIARNILNAKEGKNEYFVYHMIIMTYVSHLYKLFEGLLQTLVIEILEHGIVASIVEIDESLVRH